MNVSPWPSGKKLVHLDLKGAPPKMSYMQKLIPLIARLGADGLLLEYEDTFPYEGDVKVLQATDHPPYSREEIKSIQDVAKSNGLEIIPLVQTFGHLEFVLKHREFWELRELPCVLGTLNPHRDHSVKLVLQLVRQVLELHPDIRFLHIGADEVYFLGQGEESKHWLSMPGHDIHQLFLGHVTKVVKSIRETWPHLNLIMWDDMLRSMSCSTLKDSGLVDLVQPMLWDYSPSLDVAGTVHLLETYRSAGLSKVWAASSFKGSTDVSTCVTSTQRHVDNHLQWLQVAAALPSGIEMQGIAITGWQRYDHLSVLCELLPVAIPSLASCLETLCQGSFSKESQTKVTETLGISTVEVKDMVSNPCAASCSAYPGQRLAKLVVELSELLQSEELRFLDTNMFVKGWFTPYHRQRKIVNPLMAQQIQHQATALLTAVELKVEAVRQEMVQFFHESTAQEWIAQHVSAVLEPIRRLLEDIQVAIQEVLPPSFNLPSPGQQG
ncbi:hexosaminidase D isoform X2 [Anguilla rostrata]